MRVTDFEAAAYGNENVRTNEFKQDCRQETWQSL